MVCGASVSGQKVTPAVGLISHRVSCLVTVLLDLPAAPARVPQHVGGGDHARFVGVRRAVGTDVLSECEGNVAADVVVDSTKSHQPEQVRSRRRVGKLSEFFTGIWVPIPTKCKIFLQMHGAKHAYRY